MCIRDSPIRGNVDTRLSRIERDGLDGTILAVSGLKRLGWEGRICYPCLLNTSRCV